MTDADELSTGPNSEIDRYLYDFFDMNPLYQSLLVLKDVCLLYVTIPSLTRTEQFENPVSTHFAFPC